VAVSHHTRCDVVTDTLIVTRRLELRDYRPVDLGAVQAFWGDPLASVFMDEGHKTATEAEAWLNTVIEHNASRPRVAYNLAIVVRSSGEVIGWIGFGPSASRPGAFGVGYLLHSDHWRKGSMREALTGVIRYVFEVLDVPAIRAWCYAANVASARTLEKVGFTRVGDTGETMEFRITHS